MSLFRLDSSIRSEGSHSAAVADIVEAEWLAARPGATVVRRHVGLDPVPTEALALTAYAAPGAELSPAQREAVALAATLTDELVDAEALLFAVPLYNFGVPHHFKSWFDLVVTDPRMGPGQDRLLEGKPAVLVTVRGGAYGEGTPRAGWDHATPWLRRVLEDVWGLDLKVVEREFTLVGTVPALDSFTDMAAEMGVAAESLARDHGRAIAAERPAA